MQNGAVSGSSSDSIRQRKGLDEKYCESCGAIIKSKAVICPKCGVKTSSGKEVNKVALLLITFFLGGIGIHKFYLGKYVQGIFYILFFWTGIPVFIALIEFIIYACTSTDRLQEKYTVTGSGAVIAVAIFAGFICIIGILAAITIPNFVAYRTRSYNTTAFNTLEMTATAQEAFYVDNSRYADSVDELLEGEYGFYPTQGVEINIISGDEENYIIESCHEGGNIKYILEGPNGTIEKLPKE